jgi:hypothetical protein
MGCDLFGKPVCTFPDHALAPVGSGIRWPRPVTCRKRGVDRNLPSQPPTKISQGAGVLGAEDNFILWQKRDNEIVAIASHGDLSLYSMPSFHLAAEVYPPATAGKVDPGTFH